MADTTNRLIRTLADAGVSPPDGGWSGAVVIASGDELLAGRRVDTNSAWIAARLESSGVEIREHRLLGDDLGALTRTLREVARPGVLVVGTGGLGPTRDDLTRRALGDAMGEPLVLDQQALSEIEAWYASRRRVMPAANRVQAERPRAAWLLSNSHGTAPGLLAELDGAQVVWFPGPPPELRPMFDRALGPALESGGVAPATEQIVSVGLGESNIADRLGEMMDRGREPSVGTTASHGVVRIQIRSARGDRDAVSTASLHVRGIVGEHVIAAGPPAEVERNGFAGIVLDRLGALGLTLSTAESCTGGMIGAWLTDVPGSSAVYLGGAVSYANHAKERMLGVTAERIETHGAVSAPVVEAMARGARRALGADLSIAVSGVAGPGGGSAEKPVGTVWIGVAGPGDEAARATRHLFRGSREQIRRWAANTALADALLAAEGRAIRWLSEWPADRG